MELLTPNPGTIFWTVVTFVLLLFVLKKMAWKPILQFLDEREERIQNSLDQADGAKKEAEKLLSEQQTLLDTARKESQQIIAKSRKAAETAKEEILKQAQSEAAQLLKKAKREIDLSREKALEDIRNLAVELSLAATSKMIGKSLDKKEHMALVDESIDQIGGLK